MAVERGAARRISDVASLADTVSVYIEQPEHRRAAGAAARALVEDNRGALELPWSGSSERWQSEGRLRRADRRAFGGQRANPRR